MEKTSVVICLQSFYALAWTTLNADSVKLREDCNILAVAGRKHLHVHSTHNKTLALNSELCNKIKLHNTYLSGIRKYVALIHVANKQYFITPFQYSPGFNFDWSSLRNCNVEEHTVFGNLSYKAIL